MDTQNIINHKKIYNDIKNNNLQGLINYITKVNDVNATFKFNGRTYTPLHIAAEFYYEDMLNAILSMKPNLDIQDNNGNTPLHIAIINQNFNVVEKLLGQNISNLTSSVDIKNKDGMTPIMLAMMVRTDSKINNFIYINFLKNKNADLSVLDNDNNTLLHLAFMNLIDNFQICCTFLINNGVQLNSVNSDDITPLDIIENKIKEFQEMKNKHNVDLNKISKVEQEVLTIQNYLIVKILESNPEIAMDYPIDILGCKNDDCSRIKSGLNISLSIPDTDTVKNDELYFNKYPFYEDLSKKIKEHSIENIILTSNESKYPGDYIIRDTVFHKVATNNQNNTESFKATCNPVMMNSSYLLKVNDTELKEGFNNSKNNIKQHRMKEFIYIAIFICIVLLFLTILYKMLVI